MPFTVNVTDISLQEDEDFQAMYTFNCGNRSHQFKFSLVTHSNRWLEYICENHNSQLGETTLECSENNFDEWIKKVTKVKFCPANSAESESYTDSAEFSLKNTNNDNRIFFYFDSVSACNAYCEKHMQFYANKRK